MDSNDIHSRLERILLLTNSRIDNDFKRHAKVDTIDKGVKVQLPGNVGPVKTENDILSILHHLATLKDNIKKYLENIGRDKRDVENAINSSIHLQVLIDLVNADKHGYPTTTNRSGKNPKIKDFAQTLKNNNDGKPVIATIGTKGEIEIVHGKPPSVELFANIYDEHGIFLFVFDELVETCYLRWLAIVEGH